MFLCGAELLLRLFLRLSIFPKSRWVIAALRHRYYVLIRNVLSIYYQIENKTKQLWTDSFKFIHETIYKAIKKQVHIEYKKETIFITNVSATYIWLFVNYFPFQNVQVLTYLKIEEQKKSILFYLVMMSLSSKFWRKKVISPKCKWVCDFRLTPSNHFISAISRREHIMFWWNDD
jgi:hypothetical protein